MKSYTDIEQSKKLAEILPLSSADMFWYRDSVTTDENPRIMNYMQIPELQSMYFSPCWSLAALLSILPSVITRKGKRVFLIMEKVGAFNLYYKFDELWETKEELVDACYEMILKLHKQKLL